MRMSGLDHWGQAMNNDKELLTLAAKAAGIAGDWSIEFEGIKVPRRDYDNWIIWNPLKHDGDALRLAVKLGITVEFNSNWVGTTHEDIVGRAEFYEADPYAATRRAIVRAASEIGGGME